MPAFLNRVANFDWTTGVISPLTVILMEVFWIYPWLVWSREMFSFNYPYTPLNLGSLIFLIGVPFLVSRFLQGSRKSLRWIKLAIVMVTILIVLRVEYGGGISLFSGQWFIYLGRLIRDSFTIFQPVIPAMVVAIYLSWRGIRMGYSNLFFTDIYRSFLLGMTALILLIIVWTTSMGTGTIENLTSTVGLQVAGFFFFGLIALALGNLQSIRQRMIRDKAAPLSNRRWVIILFGIIGGIVVLAGGVASIFSPGFITMITQAIGYFFQALTRVIHYVLIPLEYLAGGLVYVVQWLLSLIRGATPPKPYEPPDFFDPGELEALEYQPVSVDIVLILKWVFFAIIVIAVIYLLFKSLSRLRFTREAAEVEEISESLWSWPGFIEDLFMFFHSLFDRWRPKRKKLLQVSSAPGWYTENDIQNIKNIREIYRHLLWDASEHGIHHRSYETPYEFAGRLGITLPDGSVPMNELTDIYVNVRYGEINAGDTKSEQANSLWKTLRRLILGLKKTR